MFRKHGLLNGNCVAAALLLLAAAQPAVGQKQAGEADVVYRNGSTIASEIPIRSGSFLVRRRSDELAGLLETANKRR